MSSNHPSPPGFAAVFPFPAFLPPPFPAAELRLPPIPKPATDVPFAAGVIPVSSGVWFGSLTMMSTTVLVMRSVLNVSLRR